MKLYDDVVQPFQGSQTYRILFFCRFAMHVKAFHCKVRQYGIYLYLCILFRGNGIGKRRFYGMCEV